VLQAINKREGQQFDERGCAKRCSCLLSTLLQPLRTRRLIEEQRQRLSEGLLLQEVLTTLSRFIEMDPLLEQLLVLLQRVLATRTVLLCCTIVKRRLCGLWLPRLPGHRQCTIISCPLPTRPSAAGLPFIRNP